MTKPTPAGGHRVRGRQDHVFLVCPVCGWFGTVPRTNKPRIYCSKACRNQASRDRNRAESQKATQAPSGSWLRKGKIAPELANELEADSTIWCYICGRPLRRGEAFGPWRIRAIKFSPRHLFEFRCICPLHEDEG